MPPSPAGQNFCPDPLSLPLALSPRPCPGLLSLLSFTMSLHQCALPLQHLMFKMCCGGLLPSSSSSVLGLVLPPCVFLQTISVVAWGFLIQNGLDLNRLWCGDYLDRKPASQSHGFSPQMPPLSIPVPLPFFSRGFSAFLCNCETPISF